MASQLLTVQGIAPKLGRYTKQFRNVRGRSMSGNSARGKLVVRASSTKTDYSDDVYQLKDAPLKDLLPQKLSGDWQVLEGGVCAPAGFKAAAFKAGLR